MIEANESEISGDLRRLMPIIGKQKASRLETAFLLGDEKYRKRIMEVISGLKATVLSDQDLNDSALIEPPSREIASKGEFQLGDILYGKKKMYPLLLNKSDLLTHLAIFGSSGSGKTNIVHYLVNELSSQEVPILIFDFSKRNYRDLLGIPGMKDKVRVFTVGRNVVPFRFNPLKPPEGVQISQWVKEFSEVFDHSYWLLGGGRHIIMKALDALYKKFSPSYPKISDLKEFLNHFENTEGSPREKNWIATAKRPLESLCMRETGEIFDCDEGMNPTKFFEKGTVNILELDSLSNDDKTFFIEIILQWIRDWMIVSNQREKLSGVIVLEEAHHVLNREKTKKFGVETVTDLIFREIRELGVGMVYVDQHPSLVSYPALGNTSTHIYMNLGLDTKYSSDIHDAADMLGLRSDDDIDYLRRLPTGHGFILIRKSTFPNPFLLKFPLMPVKKGGITDDMLREVMNLQALNCVAERKSVRHIVPRGDALLQDAIESKSLKVSSKGWEIIESLANAEGAYTSEVYNKLRMSFNVFNNEVKKLSDLGFVASREAKVYKQTAFYYFLTHEGEIALALKTGRIIDEKPEADVGEMKEFVTNTLIVKQWVPLEDSKERIVFNLSGRKRIVCMEAAASRGKIFKDIEDSAMGGEMHFVCSSGKVKNMVLQQAANYSHSHRGANLVVFIAVLNELQGKGFKKVEFGASR